MANALLSSYLCSLKYAPTLIMFATCWQRERRAERQARYADPMALTLPPNPLRYVSVFIVDLQYLEHWIGDGPVANVPHRGFRFAVDLVDLARSAVSIADPNVSSK